MAERGLQDYKAASRQAGKGSSLVADREGVEGKGLPEVEG
jgi:hypothetical protein